ncbi:MAG: Eco57I restriction-modification methylase domain-containing protein [Bacteroidetes bacterium]|nr:Eco57I restriction-modification methylase domain-containing protein [Bacteroidota bacterium]
MTAIDIKEKISAGIKAFSNDMLLENTTALFHSLGYRSGKRITFSRDRLLKEFDRPEFLGSAKANALSDHWKEVAFVFQLTGDEIKFAGRDQGSLDFGDTNKVNDKLYESYFVFAIELVEESYTRTQLSQITRAVNRLFRMPTLILFKYGSVITLSVINRRLHKREENKDVLEKVTLIKDISIASPHRAHIEILFDLSLDELGEHFEVHNFETLHEAWQKTLDTKELNKRFYIEIANWYFWASSKVEFPDDVEKNKELRNATNLIRLITRIIFIWFIKEKGLVPENLFQREKLKKIIKRFYDENGKATTYYTAILQNLFFGTLNQKMDQREFAKEGSHAEQMKQYGVKNLFRYANQFAMGETEALALFKDIPFLNGGLFDCLDKEDEEGKVKYVDGFSRKTSKQPTVPDFLFFCEEKNADLNNYYGTTSKQYKVRGLIDTLNRYKFTITENTPIEEEVALDPELLGQVFENLLASYNPETKTTARKQTGSFYTPREIVNYMVNESLITYFENALLSKNANLILKSRGETPPKNLFNESQTTQVSLVIARGEANESERKEIQEKLRQLLSYTAAPHQFTKQQCRLLIDAIDRCRILDPACGSGAFPMGILHTVVHVLHKLDPKNEEWKERQTVRVRSAIREAEKIDDPNLRNKLIADLEENKNSIDDAFLNNELDYGRKLYLIENCIYGVDIQPIAVQIAKLRFFISLVIDQRVGSPGTSLRGTKQSDVENRGIRPLPNLETKFVAANTLVGLKLPKQLRIENENIRKLKEDLKKVRHHYFNAKSRKEKLNFQKDDRKLRQRIGDIIRKEIEEYEEGLLKKIEVMKDNLKLALQSQKKIEEKHRKKQEKLKLEIEELENGLLDQRSIDEVAQKISSWDPYDQNASSSWFDSEWVFGIESGFDIVIGNPPYVEFKKLPAEQKVKLSNYASAKGKYDIYVIFDERAYALLKEGGSLCFIHPTTFMKKDFGEAIRKFINQNFKIKSILDFADIQVFQGATNYTGVFLFMKSKLSSDYEFAYHQYFNSGSSISVSDFQNSLTDTTSSSIKCFLPIKSLELEKSEWNFQNDSINYLLSKFAVDTKPLLEITESIFQGIASGKDEVFYVNEDTIREFKIERGILKKLLKGKDIKKYVVTWSGYYVIYPYDKNSRVLSESILKSEYPNTFSYLSSHKVLLKGRDYFDNSPKKWFELWNQRSFENFKLNRIVSPEITDRNNFVHTNVYYGNTKTYHIIPKEKSIENYLFLLGLLNSSLLDFVYKKITTPQAGGFYAYKTQFLSKLPIRQVEQPKAYSDIVSKIVSAKKENPQANTSRLERQLDVMIYHLYQLTFEEAKIIDVDLSEEDFEKYRIEI